MTISDLQLKDGLVDEFIKAVESRKPVTGLTHTFYRYPARYSPLFARAAIELFTQVGDVVFDPFMGGGTTLVEANALGRSAIGTDISHLAYFISVVKTALYSNKDFVVLQQWMEGLSPKLNLRNPPIRADDWIQKGYQRNISGKATWPIRKTIELALTQIEQLPKIKQRQFARCVILKSAQWALDCRAKTPTASEFRIRLFSNFTNMVKGAKEFREAVKNHNAHLRNSFRLLCLNKSAVGIESESRVTTKPSPKLVLTSPPYPGVHVLYHRW